MRAVPDQLAVVDHEQPVAEPLDVAEVVRGQEHRDALVAVDLDEEVADALLGDDVEPDRRLVEEEQLRAVEHRGGQLAADPLAERQLAHRRLQERVEVEHLPKPREVRAVALGRHLVDVAQQVERVLQREVPPELDALAEHRADLPGELDPAPRRVEPADRDPPGRGDEDAGQHLDRRRLAGAVRPEVAEQLAALDLEGDLVHRLDDGPLAAEPPAPNDEALAELLDLDHPPALR